MNKNIPATELPKLRMLCFASIQAAMTKLCEVGAWPRPFRARILRLGRDIYSRDFQDLAELQKLIDFLASQNKIRSMYTYIEKYPDILRNDILRDYWLQFLLSVLTENEGIILQRRVFNKWFYRFVNGLYSDTAVWRAIYIFDGLELATARFNLDKFTTIMSISESNLKALIPRHDRYFDLSEFLNQDNSLSPNGNAALVVTKRIHKNYGGSPWPSGKELNERERAIAALAAIRLTKGGSTYVEFWGLFQVSDIPIHEPIGLLREPEFPLRSYLHNVTLDKKDYRKVRSVWQELMDAGYGQPQFKHQSDPNAIEVARERFFKSYEDDNWFESLLDLTIALEALFGPTDRQELSHRIAMRCAWLLGSRSIAPEGTANKTFESVQALYNLRSVIVHRGSPKKKDIQKCISTITGTEYVASNDWEMKESAVEISRDIVRKSIDACSKLARLPASGPHWPFAADFDQFMLVRGQQKKWQKATGIR